MTRQTRPTAYYTEKLQKEMFYAVLYLSKKTGIIHTTSTATAAGVPDTFHQIPALKP